MARGFKTGGRKKGSRNKRTLLLESAARELIDNASAILGDNEFNGDAHALLILTYKNQSLSLDLRIDAAKAAIRFEKPALSAIDARGTIENHHYTISAAQSVLVQIEACQSPPPVTAFKEPGCWCARLAFLLRA